MEKPMSDSYKLYIDGQWVAAGDGKTFKTYCPANGELLATCADASREDVDKAVQAAWKAWDSWKKVSPRERCSALLLKIADLIDANAEKLALIETMDNGKPIRETTAIDVPLASAFATLQAPLELMRVRQYDGKNINQWLEANKDRIEVFYLRFYPPALNHKENRYRMAG